ncbi:hypothetical protein PVAP13_8NG222500 [Panicum virgatum]|uniref:Uncharacterized protein n=1 Tax=Panicum virgatum TaxID=38727 RepID=A0A8T0PH77_PANVG|nr:hypothetical protein PVAP13_8NG222500 [Panicum virgatum]
MLCASPAIIWPPAGRRWPTAAQAATLTAHALPWLRSDLLQLQAATLRSSKAFTVQKASNCTILKNGFDDPFLWFQWSYWPCPDAIQIFRQVTRSIVECSFAIQIFRRHF